MVSTAGNPKTLTDHSHRASPDKAGCVVSEALLSVEEAALGFNFLS